MELNELTEAEIMFRFLALATLVAASGYVWYQLARHRLRPRPIWLYVGTILVLTTIWRILVLGITFNSGVSDVLEDWVNPITATMYMLSALSLVLLAFCDSRRRRGDG